MEEGMNEPIITSTGRKHLQEAGTTGVNKGRLN